MKRLLYFIIVFCWCQTWAGAFNDRPISAGTSDPAGSPVFMELWNNAAFYNTNLEKQQFSSTLGRFEGKVGLNVFSLPMQLYGTYYTALSQSPKYWDNYAHTGYGARIIPWRDYPGDHWYNEWLQGIRIYGESLNASYFKDAASAEGLAKTDARYGVEIWHAWNRDKPDLSAPWGELWFKGDYRLTNFTWEPSKKFDDYVISCQPKFGRHLSEIIDAYLRADMVISGKKGPDYSFLNIADYGVGLRFMPFRATAADNDLLKTFNMFAEVLGVSYLDEKSTNVANVVNSDLRFGLELSYGR